MGFIRKGIGEGTFKFKVPEAHNLIILYHVTSEEFGTVVIVILLIYLLYHFC